MKWVSKCTCYSGKYHEWWQSGLTGKTFCVRPTRGPQSKHDSHVAPAETRLRTALESTSLLFHSEGQLLQRVLTVALVSATEMVNPGAQSHNGLRPLMFRSKVFAELRSVSFALTITQNSSHTEKVKEETQRLVEDQRPLHVSTSNLSNHELGLSFQLRKIVN